MCACGVVKGCDRPKSAVWPLRCGGMCAYGAGIARQSSDMRLYDPVGVGEWYGIE